MADNHNKTIPETAQPTEDEKAPSRLKSFVNNHPRAFKVVAVTGVALGAIGLVVTTRAIKSKGDQLSSDVARSGDGLHEVAASVSPTDPEA